MAYWKYFIWFLLLYLSAIIQMSFLPHLSIRGVVVDLVFLIIFFWIFLSAKEKNFIYGLSIFGGLLLENYSDLPFFGLWVIALFLAVLLVKKLGSIMQCLNIFSLLIIFSSAFICFKFFPFILVFPWTFSWQSLVINWGLDLIIVIFYFYLYEFFHQKRGQRN